MEWSLPGSDLSEHLLRLIRLSHVQYPSVAGISCNPWFPTSLVRAEQSAQCIPDKSNSSSLASFPI